MVRNSSATKVTCRQKTSRSSSSIPTILRSNLLHASIGQSKMVATPWLLFCWQT